MANPNVLVDLVSGVSSFETLRAPAAGPSYRTIAFQGGRSGVLDMSNPRSVVWADVLDSLRRANAPVYVEIDPATNAITNLLVPLSVRVGNIMPIADGVEVELVISHAKHFLHRSNADYDQLLR